MEEDIADPTDKGKVQKQSVYTFADRTVIRLKPKGDKFNPGEPMFSVEVKQIPPADAKLGQEGIAFKVDRFGRPVPKGAEEIVNPYAVDNKYQRQADAFDAYILGHSHRKAAQAVINDILITPIGREFDIEQIKSHLASVPNAALDPVDHHVYMLASSVEQLEDAIEARKADPKSFPYSVALVDADPARIDVSYRNTRNVESARRFVQWLRSSYEIRITDDAFNDITDQCDEGLENIFGPTR